VSHHQVKLAVAVQVCDCHGLSTKGAGIVRHGGTEGAVAVANQHANGAVVAVLRVDALVDDHQIQLAVPVHIPHRDC
jgi:hypothetical protein